jgi:hypothetical protein
MNEPIKLCVELRQTTPQDAHDNHTWMQGADALVIDPCLCSPERFEAMAVDSVVLSNADPLRDSPWQGLASHWVCHRGLDDAARLRDLHPGICWVPKLSVTRAKVGYRFSGPAIGEGFSFYMPDTSAINAWRVAGSDLSLRDNLTRAKALGFEELWLHSPGAAACNRGLDLELLDKTGEESLSIWISGGVDESVHLRNLARVGGVARVIVDQAAALRLTASALHEALTAKGKNPEIIPVTINPGVSELGPH